MENFILCKNLIAYFLYVDILLEQLQLLHWRYIFTDDDDQGGSARAVWGI